MKRIKFFASILLLVLCLTGICCAQTKIDWKQIKNIPDTLEFKNVLLEHLLFKSAYQPVMESIHMGGIYYDNQLERLKVYEHGQWRDLSVTIASDSIGAPLTILGYLQANDIYASQSAYIRENICASQSAYIKGNIYASSSLYLKDNIYASGSAYLAGGVNASGTSTLNRLKVNTSLKVPLTTDTTLGAGSIAYDTVTGKLKVLNSSNTWDNVGTDITVDSAMSSTSTNPVQNKVVNSYISQQLGSGTSDLYVRSLKAELALRLPIVGSSILGLGSIYYDPFKNRVRVIKNNNDDVFIDKDIKIKTGSHDGTITVEEDDGATFNTYNVAVKGLGSAAYANVASFTPQSTSTPPSNPYAGQTYFDTDDNVLKYWNGTSWVSISEQKIENLFTVSTGYYSDSHGSASYTEILWKPDNLGNQIVQYTGVVSTPSNSSTGRLSLWKLLDSTKPYVCVFTTASFGNTSDTSVCPSVSAAKTDSTGLNPITYFNFSIHDNDGGDTRVGTQYFFVQGFVAQ